MGRKTSRACFFITPTQALILICSVIEKAAVLMHSLQTTNELSSSQSGNVPTLYMVICVLNTFGLLGTSVTQLSWVGDAIQWLVQGSLQVGT